MKAIAVFQGKVHGVVTFEDYGENVLLKAEIYVLKKNAWVSCTRRLVI
jgi:hypothetical protein